MQRLHFDGVASRNMDCIHQGTRNYGLACRSADQNTSQSSGPQNELEDLDADAARRELSLEPIGGS